MLAHQWLPLSSFFDWTFEAILLLFTQKAPINYYIFTATSGTLCFGFNVVASEYYPVKCQIYNFRSAKRKYSISNAFDWTVIGTDFKFSTYFILHEQQIHCILNHVDNWTKQWQAGAAQLPLLGAPCFYWTSQICLFAFLLIKNWPINIHCRTF